MTGMSLAIRPVSSLVPLKICATCNRPIYDELWERKREYRLDGKPVHKSCYCLALGDRMEELLIDTIGSLIIRKEA